MWGCLNTGRLLSAFRLRPVTSRASTFRFAAFAPPSGELHSFGNSSKVGKIRKPKYFLAIYHTERNNFPSRVEVRVPIPSARIFGIISEVVWAMLGGAVARVRGSPPSPPWHPNLSLPLGVMVYLRHLRSLLVHISSLVGMVVPCVELSYG